MANTLVSIRIPKQLLQDTAEVAKAEGFANTQEFMREALREHVRKYRLQQSLIELDRLAGSAKGKRIKMMTREERDELAKRLYPPIGSDDEGEMQDGLNLIMQERLRKLKGSLSVDEARQHARTVARGSGRGSRK